ncbi:hypothetical protein [Amaricoccus sp.]|uniref:hypothetical protein n=1 Tax=Amaricoccus sp. TaxID=1872485 RepID=UPI00262057AE|nr:hypothetical protein [uncultured Amaricoccus sp.]
MSALIERIEPGSIAYISITQWLPAIFLAVVGGYFAKVVLPIAFEEYSYSKKKTEKRIEHAEKISSIMGCYIICWRRLIQIAELEADRVLDEDEVIRKLDFVKERNSSKDELYRALSVSVFYFQEKCCDDLNKFIEWDEEQSAKRLADLPAISEWRKWEARILLGMREDIRESRR